MAYLDPLLDRLAAFEPTTLPVLSSDGAGGNPCDGTPLSEQVVRLARTTGAHISFIEDPALLADVGGVGAMLRYRL